MQKQLQSCGSSFSEQITACSQKAWNDQDVVPCDRDALYLHLSLWFSCIIALLLFQCFITQSTMQGEGWPIVMSNSLLCCWCLTVWSSGSAGLPRPGCPANPCWATGPKKKKKKAGWNYSYISEASAISHVYLTLILSIWYIIRTFWEISWHLGTSSSTDHFKDMTSQQTWTSQF